MALNLSIIFWLFASVFSDETVPKLKGGESLQSFIKRSLIYPEYSKQYCIQGTVHVSFRKVQKGYGVDMDTEALRLVRLTSGLWKVPASFDTSQEIVVPINFSLREYNCEQRSPQEISDAIAAYKARENLTKAVINFYEKKSAGAYAQDDEEKIIELKDQLGYDDKFFDRLLRQAKQKLKQGDKDGACEDFNLVRQLGSDKSKTYLTESCR
jgi:hypothetical protein